MSVIYLNNAAAAAAANRELSGVKYEMFWQEGDQLKSLEFQDPLACVLAMEKLAKQKIQAAVFTGETLVAQSGQRDGSFDIILSGTIK